MIDLGLILHRLAIQERKKIIAKLLAGNDTLCFTTAQYCNAHDMHYAQIELCIHGLQLPLEIARSHLENFDGVREVDQDVWMIDSPEL